MSPDNIKAKSRITTQADRIVKGYLPTAVNVDDPILGSDSSPLPPIFYAKLESKILRVTNDIEDGKRLPPRIYKWKLDRPNPSIEVERIDSRIRTYRDIICQTAKDDGDVIKAVESIPAHVAGIHMQLNTDCDKNGAYMQSRLLTEVRWGRHNAGLAVRKAGTQRGRMWHYLRAIVYAMSPELEQARSQTKRNIKNIKGQIRTRYSTLTGKNAINELRARLRSSRHAANEQIKSYVHGKGIDHMHLTEGFVDRDFQIMYGTGEPDEDGERLMNSGQLKIVTGDLGPQHLYENGRFIDLDEARLASGVIDLVSAYYNMFVYPRGPEYANQEMALMHKAFDYLREFNQDEASEEQKKTFLTRMTEARLTEMLRLFAVDCKLHPIYLREITKDHPRYEGVIFGKLRETIITECFKESLKPFLDFWSHGEGWHVIQDAPDARLLRENLTDIDYILTKTGVFDGMGDPHVIASLEALLSD